MEKKVQTTLGSLEGELKGKYHPLTGMDKTTQQQLIDDHFLFKEGDRFLQAANACRYWPAGRGIYHNDDKTFLVWSNEEDHMRIISMQKGGNLKEVFGRLTNVSRYGEKEKVLTPAPYFLSLSKLKSGPFNMLGHHTVYSIIKLRGESSFTMLVFTFCVKPLFGSSMIVHYDPDSLSTITSDTDLVRSLQISQ